MYNEFFERMECLFRTFEGYEKVMVALSGGVDSSLAAYCARKFLGRENSVAVISNSESLKRKDFETAVNFCNEFDIHYEVIKTNELSNPDYSSNPSDRCYFCKTELYTDLKKLTEEKYKNYVIINGNNISDFGDHRPGMSAAKENEIKSPFITCAFNKADIRDLAKFYNLPVWDKPASPCLSSRFPYGEKITKIRLERVERSEEIMNSFGFDEVRVRSYGNKAVIEVPAGEVNKLKENFAEIEKQIISAGFENCEIDPEGFVSGKMNRVL